MITYLQLFYLDFKTSPEPYIKLCVDSNANVNQGTGYWWECTTAPTLSGIIRWNGKVITNYRFYTTFNHD